MKYRIAYLLLIVCATACKRHKTQVDNGLNLNYNCAFVVNSADNNIQVISTDDTTIGAKTIALPGSNYPYHAYLSTDRKWLAVAVTNCDLSTGFPKKGFDAHNTGNKIVIIDAFKGNIVKEIPLARLASNAIFTYDGQELWVGQAGDISSKILIYKVSNWSLKDSIILGKGLSEITFCSDFDMAFTCTSGDDSVQMYDVFYKSFIMNSGLKSHPSGAWPSDHHTDFIVCDGSNTVYELNADDCKVIDTIALSFKPGHICYNSLLSEAWMTDVSGNKVHWFAKVGGHWAEQGSVSVGTDPRWIAFSKDGKTGYVVNQNSGNISVFATGTHKFIRTIKVGNSPSCIAIK